MEEGIQITNYSAYVTRISDLELDLGGSFNFFSWLDMIRSDSWVFIKPNFTYLYDIGGSQRTINLILRGQLVSAVVKR